MYNSLSFLILINPLSLYEAFDILEIDEVQDETVFLESDVTYKEELFERYKKLNESIPSIPERFRRAAINQELVIELAIFTDSEFYEYVKERYSYPSSSELQNKIENILEAIIKSVELYLNHESMGQEIKIKIINEFINDNNLKSRGEIKKYLDDFCSYQLNAMQNSGLFWDHALLLTGHDLYSDYPRIDRGSSGMAFLSGMCSRVASCTIAEARSLGSTSLIISHELVHNLGVEHDGSGANSDCDSTNFIMGPKLSPGAITWSKCTRRQMSRFLDSYGSCLTQTNSKGREDINSNMVDLPGERFSGDDQCHLMYGPKWTLYTGPVNGKETNVCKGIWCRNGNNLKSPNAAALQGTECSEGRYCKSGMCVTKSKDDTTNNEKEDDDHKNEDESNEVYKPKRMSICDFLAAFGLSYFRC